jgi:hypothetical protein
LLEGVIAQADAITDIGARIEHLVKGVFSGNIFDLGAAQVLAVIVMTKFFKWQIQVIQVAEYSIIQRNSDFCIN